MLIDKWGFCTLNIKTTPKYKSHKEHKITVVCGVLWISKVCVQEPLKSFLQQLWEHLWKCEGGFMFWKYGIHQLYLSSFEALNNDFSKLKTFFIWGTHCPTVPFMYQKKALVPFKSVKVQFVLRSILWLVSSRQSLSLSLTLSRKQKSQLGQGISRWQLTDKQQNEFSDKSVKWMNGDSCRMTAPIVLKLIRIPEQVLIRGVLEGTEVRWLVPERATPNQRTWLLYTFLCRKSSVTCRKFYMHHTTPRFPWLSDRRGI